MTRQGGMEDRSVAVAYLARCADTHARARFRRFVDSYLANRAGTEHKLFVIFKGFAGAGELSAAKSAFQQLDYTPLEVDDDNFDIGAYRSAATAITCDDICFLNTNSEVAGPDWLAKLATAHRQPAVGMVSATGSYETLWPSFVNFPKFPNVHARSNAFMLTRQHALDLLPTRVPDKRAAFEVESGPASLTRRLLQLGLAVNVVGRDGRSYPIQWWPASDTFRQGRQANLLVHDNQTRTFEALPWPEKQIAHRMTWGGPNVQQSQPFIVASG